MQHVPHSIRTPFLSRKSRRFFKRVMSKRQRKAWRRHDWS